MDQLISLSVNLGIPFVIIIVALIAGSIVEKRHYSSIDEREKAFAHIPLLNGKRYPGEKPIADSRFVSGSVVIS